METRESYEFCKKLTDAGVGVMETRCWIEVPGPDMEIIAFGCGSYFRFMLGSPIFCPFCGCQHQYQRPTVEGSMYWDIYPVTHQFTGEWGTLTAEEQVKRDRASALVDQRKLELATAGRMPN
jgi:hypothetical protein